MFSTLKQGNTVHVLEQTDSLSYKTGKITSIVPNYAGGMDIRIKVDDQEYEFKQVPYNQSVANNGTIVISENKENIVAEIQKLKENSETILKNKDYYEKNVEDCNNLLRQLNPTYDKEMKRDEEIDLLKQQMLSVSQSLADIKELLSKKSE